MANQNSEIAQHVTNPNAGFDTPAWDAPVGEPPQPLAELDALRQRGTDLSVSLDLMQSQRDAARARVGELEDGIRALGKECRRDKMAHLTESMKAEEVEDWPRALAESKHAMALGWCEQQLQKLFME